MEYCFRIDREVCLAASDRLVASRIKRLRDADEIRRKRAERLREKYLGPLLLILPVLAPWLMIHRPEDVIAAIVVDLVYPFLWWRYRKPFINVIIERRRRWSPPRSQQLVEAMYRRTGRIIQASVMRLEGLHYWSLSPKALMLRGSGRKEVAMPWRNIAHVQEIGGFYQLSTRAQKRLGLAYLLAKETTEMDAEAYRDGIRQLLERIPAQAFAQPSQDVSAHPQA